MNKVIIDFGDSTDDEIGPIADAVILGNLFKKVQAIISAWN